jgi:hypothetical protein
MVTTGKFKWGVAPTGLPIIPGIMYRLPISFDVLDALLEDCMPASWYGVTLKREMVTTGSVTYDLGKLGSFKLRKTGPDTSQLQVIPVPEPLLREPTPEELAPVKATDPDSEERLDALSDLHNILRKDQQQEEQANQELQVALLGRLFRLMSQYPEWYEPLEEVFERPKDPPEYGSQAPPARVTEEEWHEYVEAYEKRNGATFNEVFLPINKQRQKAGRKPVKYTTFHYHRRRILGLASEETKSKSPTILD